MTIICVQTRRVKVAASFVSVVVKIVSIDLNIPVSDFLLDEQRAHLLTCHTLFLLHAQCHLLAEIGLCILI